MVSHEKTFLYSMRERIGEYSSAKMYSRRTILVGFKKYTYNQKKKKKTHTNTTYKHCGPVKRWKTAVVTIQMEESVQMGEWQF